MKKQFKNPHFYMLLLADGLLLLLAHLFSYLLRFEFALHPVEWHQFSMVLVWMIPLKLVFYYSFGLYRGMWRYTSGRDIRRIGEATLVLLFVIIAILFMVHRMESFSRAVFLIDAFLSMFFLSFLRLGIRYYHLRKIMTEADWGQFIQLKNRKPAVLFVDVDFPAELLSGMKNSQTHKYNIVGVVVNAASVKDAVLYGFPVVGIREELLMVIEAQDIRAVIVAVSPEDRGVLAYVQRVCLEKDIPFRMLADIQQRAPDMKTALSSEEI
jgi:FlaA1/EpsC-like NDP-sugar epimerase